MEKEKAIKLWKENQKWKGNWSDLGQQNEKIKNKTEIRLENGIKIIKYPLIGSPIRDGKYTRQIKLSNYRKKIKARNKSEEKSDEKKELEAWWNKLTEEEKKEEMLKIKEFSRRLNNQRKYIYESKS